MPDKSFERTVPFYPVMTPQGPVWLPIVTVTMIQPSGGRVDLPLVFDTGASVTTLRHDLYYLLGLQSWDVGQLGQSATAGGANLVPFYQYQTTFEVLGKTIACPVNLMPLPANPLYVGLLGREVIFDQFGFGFWESAHELYVTANP